MAEHYSNAQASNANIKCIKCNHLEAIYLIGAFFIDFVVVGLPLILLIS